MSRERNIEWIKANLKPEEICGKKVIDVGSRRWNDEITIRDYIKGNNPSLFIGMDTMHGDEVDVVLKAENIPEMFKENAFDLVLNIEVLEHVQEWRLVLNNLKSILRPGGTMILTTRLPGYPLHGFPDDYWRYEKSDMEKVFSDFSIENITEDFDDYGIYVKVKKPIPNVDLNEINLFDMKKSQR